jgi:hypothetical protein
VTPALLPHLALKREAYQKGLGAGRRSRDYDDDARLRALRRFTHKYAALGEVLAPDWLEGWRDALIYRRNR